MRRKHSQRFRRRDERGTSLVEYALLVALIAVVCIAGVTQLGGAASDKFDESASALGDGAAASSDEGPPCSTGTNLYNATDGQWGEYDGGLINNCSGLTDPVPPQAATVPPVCADGAAAGGGSAFYFAAYNEWYYTDSAGGYTYCGLG